MMVGLVGEVKGEMVFVSEVAVGMGGFWMLILSLDGTVKLWKRSSSIGTRYLDSTMSLLPYLRYTARSALLSHSRLRGRVPLFRIHCLEYRRSQHLPVCLDKGFFM